LTIAIYALVAGMIMCSLNIIHLWSYVQNVEKIASLQEYYRKHGRWLFLGISIKKDYVMIAVKLILALITMSGYMVANALFSLGMSGAKYHLIRNRDSSLVEKWKVYFHVGCCILFSSLCYMLYSIRLFYTNKIIHYSLYLAIVIALYTFVEMFLVIKDYVKARKQKDMETEQIKLMNLASLFTCVVLTQASIMTAVGAENCTRYIAVSGIVFGWFAATIGVIMLVKYQRHKKEEKFVTHDRTYY